jgi:hypothetical protein
MYIDIDRAYTTNSIRPPRANGRAQFKIHKQLFEYKHLLLLRDI